MTYDTTTALPQIYQEFESKGLKLSRSVDVAAEMDAKANTNTHQSQFNAILKASTELVVKVDTMYDEKQQQGEQEQGEQKEQHLSPPSSPSTNSDRDGVEILWFACVAHICSNQIVHQIGGIEGQKLRNLTVTQLLDLIAWVGLFREAVEKNIPSVASVHTKKTYFSEKPDMFLSIGAGDSDGTREDINKFNMEKALDVIAWANNMLWEVHKVAEEEFLLRTRNQMDVMLTRIYNSTSHETYQKGDMLLVTSLCEDVFSVLRLHLETIQLLLNKNSDTFTRTVCLMFSQLRLKQVKFRGQFLKNLETCCAAANDFQRMAEHCEGLIGDLRGQVSEASITILEENCNTLVSLFLRDAVFASQMTYKYIFEPIWENIAGDLFGSIWEKELTYNELALKMTKTMDDFIADLKCFLDKFLLQKVLKALILASVIFYVECLLLKAELHKSKKKPFFNDSTIAVERMEGDVKVIKDYFNSFAEDMPPLGQVIETEFQVITTILELLRIASGISDSKVRDFTLILHRKVKDYKITTFILGDIYHLVKPNEEKEIARVIKFLTKLLVAVRPNENSSINNGEQTDVQSLCLHKSLPKFYAKTKRKRPTR